MAYLPQAQQTKWQQSNEIDLTRTAVLVIDVLGGEEGTLDALLLINEMMSRGIGVLPVDAKKSGAATYHIEDGKLRMPYLSIAGCGSNAAFKLKEVIDAGNYMCIDDIQQQSGLNSTVMDKMREMGVFGDIPNSAQMSLFDM